MSDDKFGVKLQFIDKNEHTIRATDVEEAKNYLAQINTQLVKKSGVFGMNNKNDELVYVCNLNNLIHAMIVVIEN